MQIIKRANANKFSASSTTTIWEYFTNDKSISGAMVQINGRYPEKGFAYNEVSKELAFVVSGKGEIIQPAGENKIDIGDVILLQPNERFAWEGKLTIFMATSPKFNPGQHKLT